MARFIVVGAGVAGSAAAQSLAGVGDAEIVVLEAGIADGDTEQQWAVRRSQHGSIVDYRAGLGPGGGSRINGAMMMEPELRGADLPVETPNPGMLGAALLEVVPGSQRVGLLRRGGRRTTVADELLIPAVAEGQIRLVEGAPVTQVVFEGRRAIGVVTDSGEFSADHVVIAAGAIATPLLLLASGCDTAAVGERLSDHPAAMFTVRLCSGGVESLGQLDVVCDPPMLTTVADFEIDDGRRRGGSRGVSDRGQLLPLERLAAEETDLAGMMAALLTPRSRGRIAVGADGTPVIVLNQLSDDDDLTALVKIVKKAITALRTDAFDAVVDEVWIDEHGSNLDALENDERIAAWLRSSATGYHHMSSTCAAAVDADGALFGYDGISLVDASVLPVVPVRNPMLTVLANARRLAGALATRLG